MEVFIFIALFVIFFIVLKIQNAVNDHSNLLNKNLTILNKQLQELRNQMANLQQAPPVINQTILPIKTEEQATNIAAPTQQEKEAAELKAQEEYRQKLAAIEAIRLEREAKKKLEAEKQTQQQIIPEAVPETTIAVAENMHRPAPQMKPQESWSQRWVKNNPDIEKFIGENLISKIGIAILVLAIGFFVKFAIDQKWIGPTGRVAIGVLCGSILIGLAHRMRNSYKAFSSVLAGGGLAVLYFTITLAFQEFHLFSQAKAFIIMIIITAFAVVLSILYDKQELAIIALLGGFVSPFLVSTGSNNYQVLFSYLIILNTGLLIIAYQKGWRLLNFLSFIFTAILFGSWLVFLHYDEPLSTYRNGFLFATVFYLIYFIVNIAHNIKEKKKFIASDFGILLACTALYFATGLYCLTKIGAEDFRGLFSASLGLFNLVVSYILLRKQKVDSNILYLLVGITITFISITAPIQLHGHYITIFWASEAVLLYWLFIKSKMPIIQYTSIIVWALMLISLMIDWSRVYDENAVVLAIIFNKGFITTIFAAVATYLLFILRNKETADPEYITNPNAQLIPNKNIFRIAAVAILFAAGALEINYQFSYHFPGQNLNKLYLLFYIVSFINIFNFVTQKIKILQLHWNILAVSLVAALFLYFLSLPEIYSVQKFILLQHKNSEHFFAHWATAGLIGLILYKLMRILIAHKTVFKENFNLIVWGFCALVVAFLSVEIHLICNTVFYSATNDLDNIERVYIKTGLPILWGICSFIFMWLGMKFKYRTLRIISLSLFALTLVKLFLFDIQNIPVAGKIAAFFCLGILLLVVSFMYQRLKKIIIDDEKKQD